MTKVTEQHFTAGGEFQVSDLLSNKIKGGPKWLLTDGGSVYFLNEGWLMAMPCRVDGTCSTEELHEIDWQMLEPVDNAYCSALETALKVMDGSYPEVR